jgi:hypothetical protein
MRIGDNRHDAHSATEISLAVFRRTRMFS